LPSEDKHNQENSSWIGLFPRSSRRDADLSGDALGGDWFLDHDGDVRIRETTSMRLVAELGSGSNWAFSRKGSSIAVADSAEGDLTLRVWPWALDRLLARACDLLPRNLTREEWKRFDLPKLGLGSPRGTCKNLPFN
jgi:hypothetical protein